MYRQADAMISDAILGEVVRANLFFASTSADLATTLRAVFLGFFKLPSFKQARAQDRQRSLFIFELAAAVLATHDQTGRNVQDLHG